MSFLVLPCPPEATELTTKHTALFIFSSAPFSLKEPPESIRTVGE